jgi:1-acyl-sn-glycerol-3-phosphate acyltransferase
MEKDCPNRTKEKSMRTSMPQRYFSEDSYTTPEGRVAPFALRFPSLFFLWKVFDIVWRNGKLASAGKYGGEEWSEGSYDVLRLLERCGLRFYAEGMNNIGAFDGPCVFIGNHMSTLETFILPCIIQPRKPVTFVVKESLLGYPWFGPVLRSRDPIVVKHRSPREDFTAVMERGRELLSRGMSVIVFPQGMRTATFDPAQFNSIGIKLAKRGGVPIVPLALRADAWKVGRFIKDYGGLDPSKPVRFAFGRPIWVQDNGRAEHAEVCDFIAGHWRQWHLPEAGVPSQ